MGHVLQEGANPPLCDGHALLPIMDDQIVPGKAHVLAGQELDSTVPLRNAEGVEQLSELEDVRSTNVLHGPDRILLIHDSQIAHRHDVHHGSRRLGQGVLACVLRWVRLIPGRGNQARVGRMRPLHHRAVRGASFQDIEG